MNRSHLRTTLNRLLGIPQEKHDPSPVSRGNLRVDGTVIEKWIIDSEPGSRIPLNLYRPKDVDGRIPAVVQTCGHGDSKGIPHMSYLARTYARLGIACLVADPLGEEERNSSGKVGTRAHDSQEVSYRSEMAGRPVMGKIVFDTMRCLDFLKTLHWIDDIRLGVIGNSLGGAIAGWLYALEPRLRTVIVSGWAFSDFLCHNGKHCTRIPNLKLRAVCKWKEFLELGGHSHLLVMNGDSDVVIDRDGSGRVWRDTVSNLSSVDPAHDNLRAWFCPSGGHRPYHGYREALLFSENYLGPLQMEKGEIKSLPELNFGQWCDRHGVILEDLYGTQLHYRGAILPDLDLSLIPRDKLSVLDEDEIGFPEFTIEGWLRTISP